MKKIKKINNINISRKFDYFYMNFKCILNIYYIM